jgi:hypothetical protein
MMVGKVVTLVIHHDRMMIAASCRAWLSGHVSDSPSASDCTHDSRLAPWQSLFFKPVSFLPAAGKCNAACPLKGTMTVHMAIRSALDKQHHPRIAGREAQNSLVQSLVQPLRPAC